MPLTGGLHAHLALLPPATIIVDAGSTAESPCQETASDSASSPTPGCHIDPDRYCVLSESLLAASDPGARVRGGGHAIVVALTQPPLSTDRQEVEREPVLLTRVRQHGESTPASKRAPAVDECSHNGLSIVLGYKG